MHGPRSTEWVLNEHTFAVASNVVGHGDADIRACIGEGGRDDGLHVPEHGNRKDFGESLVLEDEVSDLLVIADA